MARQPGDNQATWRRPVPARRLSYAASTAAVISSSTGAPSGSDDTPTAPRACRPASPRISATSSLAPLATFGWSTKPGAEATNTVTWRIRSTRSNEPPSASRKADRACRAARRAASTPSSMLTWFPSDPGCRTTPSLIAICPATKASEPWTTHGRYAATAAGGGGSPIPSSPSRSKIRWSFMSGILARPATTRSDGFSLLRRLAVAGPQEGPSFHLVHPAPDAVGIPRIQGELQATLTHRTANAEGLRDRLAGVLLGPLLEVGRSEEVGRVLPPADAPLPPRSEGRVHLPGCSRMARLEIPVAPSSRELHRLGERRRPISRWEPRTPFPAPP